jgi:formylglycine-generating enzyme required for sulfatase activity
MTDPGAKRKVFLNYRRGLANGYANAVHGALLNAFAERGGADVFFDVDVLRGGERFPSMIEEHLAKSDVLLALIGADWEENIETNPEDWVRRELELAERLGVESIPVLLERGMPKLSASPELRAFAQRHAIDVKHGHWGSAIATLVERIDEAAWQTRRRRRHEHWARSDADVRLSMPITAAELAQGIERSLTTKLLVGCGDCDGSGWQRDSVERCETCDGKGVTPKRRELTLTVPAGSRAGTVPMSGAGHRLPGRRPGDLLVELSLAGASGEPIAATSPSLRARSKVEPQRSPTGPKRRLTAAILGLLALAGAALAWVAVNGTDELAELLGKTLRVDAAIARAGELMQARGEGHDAIRSWLAEAHALLAARADAQRRATDPSADADLSLSSQRFLSRLEALELLLPEMERCETWAANVRAATFRQRDARLSWDHVRSTLARADGEELSALYRGQAIPLRDEDLLGLVPLGINPATKLWEFYDLRSAWDGTGSPVDLPIPGYDGEAGHVAVRERTGIVFVLVPGGEFTMGAQDADRSDPNHDPLAEPDEAPVQSVTLAPFLIARHELTRAQWARLASAIRGDGDAAQPRKGTQATGSELFPMAELTWAEAEDCLRRHGMTLPTEAQWEYACRAGSSAPWWTGTQLADLKRIAWLGPDEGEPLEPARTTRRVGAGGAFSANRFGLLDVHGNVMEWCQDQYGPYGNPARAGDGLRIPAGLAPDAPRVLRGGDFRNPPAAARSAFRVGTFSPQTRDAQIGLRPLRRLR